MAWRNGDRREPDTSRVMEVRAGAPYPATMDTRTRPVGQHLRSWRERRRLSQLALACEAGISARHLSFLETGRSQPSRGMLLHLAERLDVPIRERNAMLMAGGFAPVFPERRLCDPALAAAREAIEIVLGGHRPFPAFAIDRHWNVVASNGALPELFEGVDEALLAPLNGLRLTLHPRGLAPRIVNLAQWRSHLLARLREQIAFSGDETLKNLLHELTGYPAPDGGTRNEDGDVVAVPFRIRTSLGLLSFFGTTTVFGSPLDVTLSEIALECFYPADAETAARVRSSATVAR